MHNQQFPSPTTVANFLLKGELAVGAVVIVDEAGQIGGRQMHQLLRMARERKARVILSGDTRQHGAVEASDALLAIERYSGIKPVELHTIRRQDPALARNRSERSRIKQYRKAVEAAAAGKLVESYKRLDQMGAIVSCGLGEQADKLTDEYLRLADQKATAVVVSQTWAEARSLLLPFNQFAFSELTTEDKQQKLRLVFATHEVLISGHALRRIETVMQRMELALIMKLPDKYRSLASESQPIIRDIIVTESRPDDAQPPAQN